MLCDIEVQDATTIVTDDKKAIEHTERDRWHGEEVHRGNCFPVIAEKVSQRLASSGSRGVRFIQREIVRSETSKPSMRSSPWMRGAPHVGFSTTDQFLNLLRRRLPPDGPPDLGDQLPVQTESAPVPTHHGFGRDRNEGLLPSAPKSTNGDPEELVEQV